MSSMSDLERWIKAQYHVLGTNQNGSFIGKKPFKDRLIDHYPTGDGARVPRQEIRQLVNRLYPFLLLDPSYDS